MSSTWSPVLELRPDRSVAAGSFEAFTSAIGRGADFRMYTEFIFEEHIVPGGDGDPSHEGLIREVIDFRETILVDGRHAAGITTLRQPLHPPFGFNGTEPKMAYFLYTMEGLQGRANLLLAAEPGEPWTAVPGTAVRVPTPPEMPKMSPETVFDAGTTGPSRSFWWAFETFRYFVRDDWEEVLAHDAAGAVIGGSIESLRAAQIAGRELKVAIGGLLGEVGDGPSHEVFSLIGSGFYHERASLYNALTHPVVRVRPAIPLAYGSRGWDLVWVHLRTDGRATVRRLDPFSRQWSDREARFACRWFAR